MPDLEASKLSTTTCYPPSRDKEFISQLAKCSDDDAYSHELLFPSKSAISNLSDCKQLTHLQHAGVHDINPQGPMTS